MASFCNCRAARTSMRSLAARERSWVARMRRPTVARTSSWRRRSSRDWRGGGGARGAAGGGGGFVGGGEGPAGLGGGGVGEGGGAAGLIGKGRGSGREVVPGIDVGGAGRNPSHDTGNVLPRGFDLGDDAGAVEGIGI